MRTAREARGAAGRRPARLLASLADPALAAVWREALARGATNTVFLTPEYQRAWWRSFGRGRLLPALVEEDGRTSLAPLFADQGMVFLVGSGGSDYLDLVGDPSVGAVSELLAAARAAVPDFLGFLLYHVPDASPTRERLAEVAPELGLTLVAQHELAAPVLDLDDVSARSAALSKQSLRRHVAWFRRNGSLETSHESRAAEILPRLDDFFAQHVARWRDTPSPSLFHDPRQRDFYRALVEEADGAGWLRFTTVRWEGRPVAYHFGFHHGGRWLWYKPSFDVELARRSPGEVLLAALLDRAVEEGARVFDFGLGEEPFKARFASRTETVRDWGLYP